MYICTYIHIYIYNIISAIVIAMKYDDLAPGLSEFAGHLAWPRLGSQQVHPAAGARAISMGNSSEFVDGTWWLNTGLTIGTRDETSEDLR